MSTLTLVKLSGNRGLCGTLPEWPDSGNANLTVLALQTNIMMACPQPPLSTLPLPPLPSPPLTPSPLTPPAPPLDEDEDNVTIALLSALGQWPGEPDHLRNWDAGTSYCTWYGIACSQDNSTLVGISLPSSAVNGPLPSSWSSLTTLTTITIHHGGLTGELPSSWSTLTNLERLSLGPMNNLTGTIPPEWSELINLAILDLIDNLLVDNLLEGEYPPQFSTLMNLTQVMLNENALGGPWPQFPSGSDKLRILELYRNEFSGPYPASWAFYDALDVLYIGHMQQLTGSLPPEWSSFKRLATLDVSNCPGLVGTVPKEWAAMKSLVMLNAINSSGLCGAIPKWTEVAGTLLNQSCPSPPPAILTARPPLPPKQPEDSRSPPSTDPGRPSPSLEGPSPDPGGLSPESGGPSPDGADSVAGPQDDSSSDGMSGGDIAGIIVGVLIAMALLAVVGIYVAKRYEFDFGSWREKIRFPGGGLKGSNYHAFEGHNERTCIIGSDETFSAPTPMGGSGQHSRGSRARGAGATISPFVQNLIQTQQNTSQHDNGVQMSNTGSMF
eukprot:gene29592-17905_t